MTSNIRVQIVDSSIPRRDALKRALESTRDMTVSSVSPTGKTGLEKLAQDLPTLILLSASISDVNAEDFVAKALALCPSVGVIITAIENDASAAQYSVGALAAGAFDFVLLPALDRKDLVDVVQRRLVPKIRSFTIKKFSRIARAQKEPAVEIVSRPSSDETQRQSAMIRALKASGAKGKGVDVVVIGVSTGGPEALMQLMPGFPGDFPIPIAIVLHMPSLFTGPMAGSLDKRSAITVKEAVDGEDILPGTAYLAPGGMHLEFERATRGRVVVRTTDGPQENGCKPAVDVLFRSAAKVYHDRVLAAVLTGMGTDGTKGAACLKAEGAYVVVQDEASSVVWGMPGSIVRENLADMVLPLKDLATHIVNRIRG